MMRRMGGVRKVIGKLERDLLLRPLEATRIEIEWKSMLNELQRVNPALCTQRYIAINVSCYIPCYIDKV